MFKRKEKEFEFDNIDINKLSEYKKPILLDFGGNFCQPCEKYKKVLIEIKEKYNDEVLICTYDVAKDLDIAYQYNVAAIPHQVFIDKDGNECDSHIGFLSFDDTMKYLERCGLEK